MYIWWKKNPSIYFCLNKKAIKKKKNVNPEWIKYKCHISLYMNTYALYIMRDRVANILLAKKKKGETETLNEGH